MPLQYRIVRTRAGFVGLVASPFGLRRSYLPEPTAVDLRARIARDEPDAIENDALLPRLAQQMEAYFTGEPVTFDAKLDVSDAPAFHRSVWAACQSVAFGETATYKDLARKVRNPAAARAVGNAMRCNRLPLIVPCHRIVKSDGGLGGFSAPTGLNMKRRLLELESQSAVHT